MKQKTDKSKQNSSSSKHQKPMERKKPRPIKELKEEYENG